MRRKSRTRCRTCSTCSSPQHRQQLKLARSLTCTAHIWVPAPNILVHPPVTRACSGSRSGCLQPRSVEKLFKVRKENAKRRSLPSRRNQDPEARLEAWVVVAGDTEAGRLRTGTRTCGAQCIRRCRLGWRGLCFVRAPAQNARWEAAAVSKPLAKCLRNDK